jgi:hypothetical protein
LTVERQARTFAAGFQEHHMRAARPVSLDVHAVATLRYIRASMDAASSVAVPGSAGIVMGLIAFVAAGVSLVPSLQSYWLAIWLVAAPIAASAGAVLLASSASPTSLIASGAPGRKLAFGLLPCLFAGAVMTAVLWSAERTPAIPGTWLLLYGCALISASVSTTRIVAWMGSCFVAFGIAAFVVPPMLQIPLLALGFGGLHILFGILIGRGAHGRET